MVSPEYSQPLALVVVRRHCPTSSSVLPRHMADQRHFLCGAVMGGDCSLTLSRSHDKMIETGPHASLW